MRFSPGRHFCIVPVFWHALLSNLQSLDAKVMFEKETVPAVVRKLKLLMQVPSDADPEHEGSNSIKNIAERVAANIVNLGQHIRDSAAHLLVNLGYQIHQLL